MKKQRGVIADGWILLIGVVVVLGLVSAIIYGIKGYLDGVDQKGYRRGVEETKKTYVERDNAALQAAINRVKNLEAQARAKEHAHAAELVKIDHVRQQEAARAKDQSTRDVAAARAGDLRLRDPGRGAACAPDGGRSSGTEARATAGERDATPGADLSGEAAAFLLDLANEADDVTRQLGQAQAVILVQLKTCNNP